MANAKPTLESVITQYRREASALAAGQTKATPELEIRLQDLTYETFATIYSSLVAKKGPTGDPVPVGEGAITQMVSSIMDVHTGRQEGGQRHPRPMWIREILFESGKRAGDRYTYKEPLVLPVRFETGGGPSYIVALSSERPEPSEFSSDEGAIIRVKARASFPLTLVGVSEPKAALQWRVDMTVTRRLAGGNAQELPTIVARMFRTTPEMTVANFLAVLGLKDDMNPAARALYRYEVEAEFLGPEDARDSIRPGDVAAAAAAVLRLANPEHVREAAMQSAIFRVAQHVARAPGILQQFRHELGLKNLLPQAITITRADYRDIYPPRDMYLTDKADGKRAIALLHDGAGCIVADSLTQYPPMTVPPPPERPGGRSPAGPGLMATRPLPVALNPRYIGDTIVDGELVGEPASGGTFYAFDVIAVAGEDVTQDVFEKRLARLPEAVKILRDAGLPAVVKPYSHITADTPRDLERVIRSVYEAARPYAIDGLIFVKPGAPYDGTKNYKWKSARDNTIDFLARRAPSAVLGREPFIDKPGHKIYFFFVGVAAGMYEGLGLQPCPGYTDLFGATGAARRGDRGGGAYFPIQFSPSDAPMAYIYHHPDASPAGEIDGKVVEARCGGPATARGFVEWEVVRVREDRRRDLLTKRYFGNNYHHAELTWLNTIDPFPVEQLWEGPSTDYFAREKSGVYRAQTAMLSFMKTRRITSDLKHMSWVLDLGAGKGQDLGRFFEAEVQHLVAVDRDRAAIAELVRRRHDIAAKRSAGPHRGKTAVHVVLADLSEPYTETLERLKIVGLRPTMADAVVCNLAVHYFLGSVESMRNFIALARAAVKVGGLVVLTILVGEAVHALFRAGGIPEGGTWDIRESESLKYSLKRMYRSDTLEAAGQRIGVLLPFSDGRYYEEFLVNQKVLAAEFGARGFSQVTSASAASLIPEFEIRNRTVADMLTAGDREYLSLYGEVVFRRDK